MNQEELQTKEELFHNSPLKLIEEIIKEVNAVKKSFAAETKENISDWKIGQINDVQVKAMLISGRTQALEYALNEMGQAGLSSRVDKQRLSTLDRIRTARIHIQMVIEDGRDVELFKEKVSLLLTNQFMNSDEVVEIPNSFSADFEEIINIYLDRHDGEPVTEFERAGEEISFGIPVGNVRLCDIETAPSRYNLPDGYYIAKIEGIESDSIVAFNASEIMAVFIQANPNMKSKVKDTEKANPDFKEIQADYNNIGLIEKKEFAEVVYRCYVADDKQAYNVLLYIDPSNEYQEQKRFYVEGTDGNAIASGAVDGLFESSADEVMKQIGVYGRGIDSITYRLRDHEEEQKIHDRSLEAVKLPYMAEFTTTFMNLYGDDQINKEVIYCADASIASKVSEYKMDENDRFSEMQGTDDINLTVDIKEQVPNLMEYYPEKRKELIEEQKDQLVREQKEKMERKEKYETEKTEDYFKKREEIEEQKKREQRQKEEQKAEEKKKKEEERTKKVKDNIKATAAEILLLQEFADLKAELSQVKIEISSLRKELGAKERDVEIVSKKDTKKRLGR